MKAGLEKSLATIDHLCEVHNIELPHSNVAEIEEALWANKIIDKKSCARNSVEGRAGRSTKRN